MPGARVASGERVTLRTVETEDVPLYDTPAVGAGAFDCNDASRGLLESLGFVEEGRRRKFMFVDGAHRDMVRYGLLREEWRTDVS